MAGGDPTVVIPPAVLAQPLAQRLFGVRVLVGQLRESLTVEARRPGEVGL